MSTKRFISLGSVIFLLFLLAGTWKAAYAQGPITHQITLPAGQSWCDDSSINTLLATINQLRGQNGVAALTMNAVGMKDAEIRASQFALYMDATPLGTPGFNPHQDWDTLAASLGYNVVGEDLAYLTSSVGYIVYSIWQDTLHLNAMLNRSANVAGVSCIYDNGVPYWTYEPGQGAAVTAPPPTPSATGGPTLDSQELAFLPLINAYRAQNGAGPLQVSIALENSSHWMSNDMATHNGSSHTDSLGRDPFTRMNAFGYNFYPWGENINGGYSDAQSAFNAWATACDPDGSGNCTYAHKQNMLNPQFVVIGIGRAYNPSSQYGWYWTTDFGGVLDATVNLGGGGGGGSAPVISSFTANPFTLTQGQSSTLSWNVSGATSITLDNGVGDVSNLASRSVSPVQTGQVNYNLTATNALGSTTARLTLQVNPAINTGPPVIGSFTANPYYLSPGQTTTLSWSVTGATSVTLDNGIGPVTNQSSVVVSPAQAGQTTYTLTASNNSGLAVARITVQVNAATTGPPVITSFGANPFTITLGQTTLLSWNVSGATSLTLNNGVGDVTNLSSKSVTPNQAGPLNYTLIASNGLGSVSAVITVQVNSPAGGGGAQPCPAPATGAFTGCYYGNTTLSGNPVLVRTDSQIAFDWGSGSPDTSVPAGNFSVRWQGNFSFAAGTYAFTAKVSDGVRVYIDGSPILNWWQDQSAHSFTIQQPVSQGTHLIEVDYYEHTGQSTAHFSWPGNTPPPGTAPVVSSFTANPFTITAGQSTTLSWAVTGATAITLDNGVGVVTNLPSVSVSPTQTTNYNLTATNSYGGTAARITVQVNPPSGGGGGDTQPPSAPVITSSSATGATEVDLIWSASTDNVGVAGYQISRNGVPINTVPGSTLTYADTTVSPGTTYTYTVKAFDAAGNYSGPSNTGQAATPAAGGSSTSCPGPATNAFTGCYFANTVLSGNPVLVRTDSQINFDWGSGAPAPSVPAGNFSVRWQGNFSFAAGVSTFTIKTSDGMKVYIDGSPILNWWQDLTPRSFVVTQALSAGTHLIEVDYYEHTGQATAHFSWPNSAPPPGVGPVISSFTATPSSISAGQSTTLAWFVAGASSLSVDNGVGTVSGSSMSVAPSQTTTYTLTASNSSGTSTAAMTVSVNGGTGVDQPPTGHLDGVTGAGIVSGWAQDPDNAGAPVQVQIYVDNNAGSGGGNATIPGPAPQKDAQGNWLTGDGAICRVDLATPGTSLFPVPIMCQTINRFFVGSMDYVGGDGKCYHADWNGTAAITCATPNYLPRLPNGVVPNMFDASFPWNAANARCFYTQGDTGGTVPYGGTDESICGFGGASASAQAHLMILLTVINGSSAGGSAVATITAGDSGPDVAGHGFNFQLPAAYNDGRPHQVWAWAVDLTDATGAHNTQLPGSPATVTVTGPGSGTTAPTISAFTANPFYITEGQSSTLSWIVSGATSITLDNGVGLVTNLTSIPVSPPQVGQTTYTLIASNSAGTATSRLTIQVNPASASGGDTQSPTGPVITSSSAHTAAEVDLIWSASADNVGVTGYQISRNGTVIGSVTGGTLTYADTTVNPSTTYSYTVKAFDAAGNYSNASNTGQAATPAGTAAAACPGPATNTFTGCYYSNTMLNGNPVLVRNDNQISFDWNAGSPDPVVPAGNFSARWQGNFTFVPGTYSFTVAASDGMRLYIDGYLALDRWSDHPASRYVVQEGMTQGSHLIVVEYYDHTGQSTSHLNWQQI